ncbi:MAG: hypothetical protein HFE63_01900 [Clostridiales bacterium]|nr:hypothetical protein [Clostridiales bacterium]
MAEVSLNFRSPDIKRLLDYGFHAEADEFIYETQILGGQFRLLVRICGNKMTAHLYDTASNDEGTSSDEYVLHLNPNASGEFVGRVRSEYEAVIDDIARRCFDVDVFKNAQTIALIKYAREKYSTEPDYPWADSPDNAVLRRADNAKWYAAILTAPRRSLGMDGDGKAEVVDIRADAQSLVNGDTILLGYHMNKKNWITIPLDGRMSDIELYCLVDQSYDIAAGKPRKR